jgi:hypothetical protein
LCSQRKPNVQIKFLMFFVYRSFVPNTGWKHVSLKLMIFVNDCSTWSIVELKTSFEKWITRNDVKGVLVSPFLFHNTYRSPVLTYETGWPNEVYYVWVVDAQSISAKVGLETWFPPNDDIRVCLLDKRHGSTKNAFWGVNNINWSTWCKFVTTYSCNNTCGLPVLTTSTKCPY